MKLVSLLAVAALVFSLFAAVAQGTFIYDQQSSTDETPIGGNGAIQNLAAPYGQSFTPTFSAVSFIKLQFSDGNAGNSLGATLFVNLRTGSVSGSVLSSTIPVTFQDGFVGIAVFDFPSSVALTPGATYFLNLLSSPATGGISWPQNSIIQGAAHFLADCQ